ncbi:glycosyltransferase family 2 protein [Enterobacter hormaechei]|uniref:glycosyltransferase family 2 protein n=1 Tax=Enterobacter hormaechei TaxID=158836 RepID=UPI0018EDD11B|nr:glycosyltransferase family 2 protein [Enterobacter hormaechei]MBJ6425926.1 glycosyltransferase [Enterobacter hormaechei]
MHNKHATIDIVLATYNGGIYIEEQLNSIINMVGFNDLVKNVIVCDDSSTDGTLQIVKKIIPKNKLIILENTQRKTFGPAKNFERGINHTTANYVMLSDQDDFWEKDKLLAYYEEAQKLNDQKPFIIFSDLEVVDSDLNTIDPSFLHFQSIDNKWYEKINNLLIQNMAPGCTMMFNKELIKASMPFPRDCLMHDWWLMLVCNLYGQIKFIQDKTFIKYRQHSSNQVGAKKNSIVNNILNLSKSINTSSVNLHKTIKQMMDFKERYHNDIPSETKSYIEALNLFLDAKSSPIQRVIEAKKVKMQKSSFIKTVGTYLIIFKGLNK